MASHIFFISYSSSNGSQRLPYAAEWPAEMHVLSERRFEMARGAPD